ncbi:two-component system OmpR family response regulator [Agrobacterium tumefaciens]|uniref:Two-component system OmpR family response regulator n=1 Tax=Agrobacterium radiobacter TaxID=362 RepID=A0ABR6JE82_AGRRD|nr:MULTISPECIES: response regulator [Agrobacterium tumefaciens complex]MBB4321220.1 two-component system OmpR family response regulator [Agrobacterium radiobacter]MBB4338260.1 two-component system OmpR family response regulator [Agrobacterium radiobacter]MBB4493148.1 two-component system OmpR family response regulator [Agrobacterium radiobacter]MBB4498421.1 two-component system OmpR family response regulator [Agrobacterium radiobacter]MBB4503880.1 two-component system OmpR family response regu
MDAAAHIVVVDDHGDIRDLVQQYLEQQGYRVTAVESGAALRRLLEKQTADLIVLDVMMPGEDGLSVCRQLRTSTATPVIFLTAMADDTDRIIGLELGADDYLVKPFNPRELLARIRAVLRRSGNPTMPLAAANLKNVRVGPWRVNLGRQEISGEDGVGIPLSSAEFRLLKVFIERPGFVLSREQLLDLTVGRTADVFDRTIDNQVSRLRKKIEDNPKNPSIIKTHWGGGYSLSVEVAPE